MADRDDDLLIAKSVVAQGKRPGYDGPTDLAIALLAEHDRAALLQEHAQPTRVALNKARAEIDRLADYGLDLKERLARSTERRDTLIRMLTRASDLREAAEARAERAEARATFNANLADQRFREAEWKQAVHDGELTAVLDRAEAAEAALERVRAAAEQVVRFAQEANATVDRITNPLEQKTQNAITVLADVLEGAKDAARLDDPLAALATARGESERLRAALDRLAATLRFIHAHDHAPSCHRRRGDDYGQCSCAIRAAEGGLRVHRYVGPSTDVCGALADSPEEPERSEP